MGVTVHRGGAAPAAADAAAEPPKGRHVQLFAAGVRIHRDAVRPAMADAFGATVGPEEAPDAI